MQFFHHSFEHDSGLNPEGRIPTNQIIIAQLKSFCDVKTSKIDKKYLGNLHLMKLTVDPVDPRREGLELISILK